MQFKTSPILTKLSRLGGVFLLLFLISLPSYAAANTIPTTAEQANNIVIQDIAVTNIGNADEQLQAEAFSLDNAEENGIQLDIKNEFEINNTLLAPEQFIWEGVITNIKQSEANEVDVQVAYESQLLEVELQTGPQRGAKVLVDTAQIQTTNQSIYKVGDKVLVTAIVGEGLPDQFYISDYVRRPALLWLLMAFVAIALVVGRWQGLSSLVGMAYSFFIIFSFILPRILAGADPVLIAILGAALIMPVTFYLAHGVNKKTTVAMMGTLITLLLSGFLARQAVVFTKLSGMAAEEMSFLQATSDSPINARGLLLAGIIIGLLGVLDDVTVSQAAIVVELRAVAKKLSLAELYWRAMRVGHDHIASVINTLVLVYTGAALPLLLLFMDGQQQFGIAINYEIIAEEVVRTLVASIGLILAVPITTALAAVVLSDKDALAEVESEHQHHQHHKKIL